MPTHDFERLSRERDDAGGYGELVASVVAASVDAASSVEASVGAAPVVEASAGAARGPPASGVQAAPASPAQARGSGLSMVQLLPAINSLICAWSVCAGVASHGIGLALPWPTAKQRSR